MFLPKSSYVMAWINFQMKSYFQQYVQSRNLQLSSTLASFGFRPRFFNIFSSFRTWIIMNTTIFPAKSHKRWLIYAGYVIIMLLFNEVKPASRWLVVFWQFCNWINMGGNPKTWVFRAGVPSPFLLLAFLLSLPPSPSSPLPPKRRLRRLQYL